jgi:hypothetical protein
MIGQINTMFIIEPEGGLCNRLRALDSAIAFAEENSMQLGVMWILGPSCNCSFSDLFMVPRQISRLFELKVGYLEVPLRRAVDVCSVVLPHHFLDLRRVKELEGELGSACRGVGDYLRRSIGDHSIILQSHSRFYYPSFSALFSNFVPQKFIQDIIAGYNVKNMVGVHIRRTDNQKSIINAPFEKFVQYMQAEIDADRDTKFFLATDDPKIEIALKHRFPQRIVTHVKKSVDRNNPIAIRDAVIDLYCLSNCRKLVGTYWSSFSETASEIRGIELILVGSSPEQPNGKSARNP